MKKITELLNVPIKWEKGNDGISWHACIEGWKCKLIMNDFPEEALYTLIWKEDEIDLDDVPSCWVIDD